MAALHAEGKPPDIGRRQRRTEVISMNIAKKWTLAVVLAGSIAGGAIGGTLLSASPSSAATNATTTTTSTTATAPATAPTGVFHSNEATAHEAGESAAREAQETAGQFPTVP
jgi:hypothetical protein